MQGGDRVQTLQMTDAIRYVLEQQDWKAGDLNVAYQACDDSTAQTGSWDSGKCSENGLGVRVQREHAWVSSARSTRGVQRSSSRC